MKVTENYILPGSFDPTGKTRVGTVRRRAHEKKWPRRRRKA